MPASPPYVLIIRRRYLGDLVLLGAFLRNLRMHWPAARIAVLAEPRHAGVLALNPDVNDTIATAGRMWPLARRLRVTRFTHVFDLENTTRTALLSGSTGAPVRVGLHHGNHPLKLRWCYTHRVHDPGPEHESRSFAEYFLQALQAVDLPVVTHEVRLVPSEADRAFAHAWFARETGASAVRSRRVLIHPGSRSPWRLWPSERFAAVIDGLHSENAAIAILVAGPAERHLVTAIGQQARTAPRLITEPLSIGQFAALAEACDCLLCHDSGPMHVAAAVGTPVVALFGSQNANLWRPAGAGHIVLQPPRPCAECVAPAECVRDDSYRNFCVRNLTTEQVRAALRRSLQQPVRDAASVRS